MDESDLDDLHRAILDELQKGRITPSYVAEQTGESRQLMSSRLRDLVMGGHARKVHKGLYELADDPRETNDDA
jgi:DNA-binding Lrp family transcriptional regulator